MVTQIIRQKEAASHCVYGFEAIQEFEHDSGLVEGIGYRNGELVRYSAGSPYSSPFECEPISLAEALHWWAQLHDDQTADSAAWTRDARTRFFEKASQALTN